MSGRRTKPALGKRPASAAPAFDLEQHVFYLFTQIFGRRNRHLSDNLKSFRITVPKWRVLSVLHERPNCTMNRLADLTTVDRTTLTRTLDQLVRDGLVERLADPRDGRSIRLRLSARGTAAFQDVLPHVIEQNERAVEGVSDAELATFRAVLHRMVRNLDPDYDSRNARWEKEHAGTPAPKLPS